MLTVFAALLALAVLVSVMAAAHGAFDPHTGHHTGGYLVVADLDAIPPRRIDVTGGYRC